MNKIKLKQIEEITADNVVMGEDLVVTKSVGEITVPAGGSVTINHLKNPGTQDERAKTVTELLDEMFSKETNPTITQPDLNSTVISCAVGVPAVNKQCPTNVEVGTSIKRLVVKAVFNPGKYSTNKPNPSGVTLEPDYIKVRIDLDGETKITEDQPNNQSVTHDMDTPVIRSNVVVNLEATHTAGEPGRTNKGNVAVPEVRIPGGTVSRTVTAISTFRSYFYGVSSARDTIDSAFIRSLTNSNEKVSKKAIPTILHPSATDKMVVVAFKVENGVTDASMGLLDASGNQYAALPISRKLAVQVYDATGDSNPVEYKVCIADAEFQGNENIRINLI